MRLALWRRVLQARRPERRTDFPAVAPGSATAWITLDGKVLRDMLGQTMFAISHDESRYALNGVLFARAGQEIRLVATDGHRLALAVRPLGEIGATVSGIVPRKAVQEIARIVGSGEEVQVAISDNQFMLQMPNVLLMARLIEGTFPNYEQVVPKAHPHKIACRARRADSGAPARVGPLRGADQAGEVHRCPRRSLKLTAYSPDYGEAEEQIGGRSTRAKRSRSASTRATCWMPLARRRRAGRDRIEGRFEPRSGQKLRGGGIRSVLSCP